MSQLTLYVDSNFISPWAMCAFVALEEKQLPYTLEAISLAEKDTFKSWYHARTKKLPAIVRGDFWLAESSAIGEWLAESYPAPAHPRLFPENLDERGICRELQSWLRTDLTALRKDRPTTSLWGLHATSPLSADGQADAKRLIDTVTPLLAHGRATLFAQWCIADADLSLALQRLNLNGDELPAPLRAYAEANWRRPSLAKWNAMKRM